MCTVIDKNNSEFLKQFFGKEKVEYKTKKINEEMNIDIHKDCILQMDILHNRLKEKDNEIYILNKKYNILKKAFDELSIKYDENAKNMLKLIDKINSDHELIELQKKEIESLQTWIINNKYNPININEIPEYVEISNLNKSYNEKIIKLESDIKNIQLKSNIEDNILFKQLKQQNQLLTNNIKELKKDSEKSSLDKNKIEIKNKHKPTDKCGIEDNNIIQKNIYTLENANLLFKETIKINNKLDINENLNNDINFKEIVNGVYINNYNKIETFWKLNKYILKKDNNDYIDEINKIYNIDTKDKKKKLNLKIKRCHNFINAIKNNSKYNIDKTTLTPTFLISLKTDEFNSFIKDILGSDYENK